MAPRARAQAHPGGGRRKRQACARPRLRRPAPHEYIEGRADGCRIFGRDAPPSQPEGAFPTLLSQVAAPAEHILEDELARGGFSPGDGAMHAQTLVGVVAVTGQWWQHSPDKREVAAHLVDLAWNGLTGLQKDPELHSLD